MLATHPRADINDTPTLDAPTNLTQRYLELTRERRALEDQLAYIRSELELLAAPHLRDAPRARFLAPQGAILVRAQPTCVFDRGEVSRRLQRAGRLADVATVSGPALARFLAKEPRLAAHLADVVRPRQGLVMVADWGGA